MEMHPCLPEPALKMVHLTRTQGQDISGSMPTLAVMANCLTASFNYNFNGTNPNSSGIKLITVFDTAKNQVNNQFDLIKSMNDNHEKEVDHNDALTPPDV